MSVSIGEGWKCEETKSLNVAKGDSWYSHSWSCLGPSAIYQSCRPTLFTEESINASWRKYNASNLPNHLIHFIYFYIKGFLCVFWILSVIHATLGSWCEVFFEMRRCICNPLLTHDLNRKWPGIKEHAWVLLLTWRNFIANSFGHAQSGWGIVS